MGVGFEEACVCDFDELSGFMEFCQARCSAIAHAGAEAAEKLGDGVAEGAFEWDSAFDAFGDECGAGFFDGEVAVG